MIYCSESIQSIHATQWPGVKATKAPYREGFPWCAARTLYHSPGSPKSGASVAGRRGETIKRSLGLKTTAFYWEILNISRSETSFVREDREAIDNMICRCYKWSLNHGLWLWTTTVYRLGRFSFSLLLATSCIADSMQKKIWANVQVERSLTRWYHGLAAFYSHQEMSEGRPFIRSCARIAMKTLGWLIFAAFAMKEMKLKVVQGNKEKNNIL